MAQRETTADQTRETVDLNALACAVADEWAHEADGLRPEFYEALDALEAATRENPLRKVRP